jgi:hypothetical protein
MSVGIWLLVILAVILTFYFWWFMALLFKHDGPRGLRDHIKSLLEKP